MLLRVHLGDHRPGMFQWGWGDNSARKWKLPWNFSANSKTITAV